MNYDDVVEQWKYITALPADENGFTNPYEGVSFEEYKTSVLPRYPNLVRNTMPLPGTAPPGTHHHLRDTQPGNSTVLEPQHHAARRKDTL